MAGYIGTKPRPTCTILSRLERDLYGHYSNAGDDELLQTIRIHSGCIDFLNTSCLALHIYGFDL